MSYLLDTNALSEITRSRPDEGYVAWFESTQPEDLYLSALTVGEIRRGVELLEPGPRRSALERANREFQAAFHNRILPVDVAVAVAWGDLSARHRRAGLVVGAIDEILAATALAHDLIMVTRNARHFEAAGCRLLCPWSR